MKSLKPGRIDEELVETVEEASAALPRSGVVDKDAIIEEIETEEKKRLTTLRGMSSFAKKSAIVVGLLAGIVLVGAIYDTFYSASSMLHNAPALGIVYLVMLFALIGILGYGIFKEYLGYRKIGRIDRLQQRAETARAHSRHEARAFAESIIDLYRTHADPQVRARVAEFAAELPALMDEEIMERLEEKVLAPMDTKARGIISKYANQTALSTAISPVAIIDAILILSRSHVMIKEVAEVYNLRPNLLGEIALAKRVFINLAFAGASDILLHHSHDILGASLLSKVSAHGAQGIANGILTARVGLGALRACRPVPLRGKEDGFFKNILKMIAKSLVFTKK